MKYLAPKLKHRIQLKKPIQGLGQAGFNRDYETITSLWAMIETLNPRGINFGTSPVRYQNAGDEDTHRITVRTSGLSSIGKAFTKAFSTAFATNAIDDINKIKADYFIFHQTSSATRGRLMRINRIMNDEDFKEFITLRCSEIEEQGTGAA